MLGLIAFVLSSVATTVGYIQARTFTAQRLRFVNGVHSLKAPIGAGLGATLLATPITWLLPLVGGGTAIFFGVAVGLGVAAGARDIRRRIGAG